MPINAASAYTKWIENPAKFVDGTPGSGEAAQMSLNGKIVSARRKKIKGAERDIHAVLNACLPIEQYERDVAMWYGYCNKDGAGARMCLRLFAAMAAHGMFYRKTDASWGDFGADFPDVPVASMLSHGGRILFLLPMSNSSARVLGKKALTLIKGVTYDPLKALVDRGQYHTMRGKSTAGAVALHGLARLSGVASVLAVVNTPHKVYAAGDDRYFDYLTNGDLHGRALATHSTIESDPGAVPVLPKNHRLWFTEEKAGGGSNVRDAMMGRHNYKNVALGGVGQMNPFSGMTITKDGSHGHLYANYRAPSYKQFGCLLLGVEGSAPGMGNQYGKVHDANATKGEWSATGGKKWSALMPNTFWDPPGKADVTQFVCDLSYLPTSVSKGVIEGIGFTPAFLGAGIRPTAAADWVEVLHRLG